MATLDQGGRMSRLMHEGSKMRKSPRPPPRATTNEAKHILYQKTLILLFSVLLNMLFTMETL
jgi:hypothetical protein